LPRSRAPAWWSFFGWLEQEYIAHPDGLAPREAAPLSAKLVNNIHTNLSALWHWALDEGLVKVNVIRQIEPPLIVAGVVQTITKEEVEALLQRGTATAKNETSLFCLNSDSR
jgi:site-specific recombinase XerD